MHRAEAVLEPAYIHARKHKGGGRALPDVTQSLDQRVAENQGLSGREHNVAMDRVSNSALSKWRHGQPSLSVVAQARQAYADVQTDGSRPSGADGAAHAAESGPGVMLTIAPAMTTVNYQASNRGACHLGTIV